MRPMDDLIHRAVRGEYLSPEEFKEVSGSLWPEGVPIDPLVAIRWCEVLPDVVTPEWVDLALDCTWDLSVHGSSVFAKCAACEQTRMTDVEIEDIRQLVEKIDNLGGYLCGQTSHCEVLGEYDVAD